MAEGYIQHNPNVPSGRAAFIDFFSKLSPPKPIEDRIKAPLVAMLADGDYVMLAFVREYPDPKDAAHRYTTTWFDLFRLENGKIAEHWDGATSNPERGALRGMWVAAALAGVALVAHAQEALQFARADGASSGHARVSTGRRVRRHRRRVAWRRRLRERLPLCRRSDARRRLARRRRDTRRAGSLRSAVGSWPRACAAASSTSSRIPLPIAHASPM